MADGRDLDHSHPRKGVTMLANECSRKSGFRVRSYSARGLVWRLFCVRKGLHTNCDPAPSVI